MGAPLPSMLARDTGSLPPDKWWHWLVYLAVPGVLVGVLLLVLL